MRPIIVSVGPLGAASANNIATSQSPGGVSGSATATFTASSASIAATNSFVAGQPVTFTNVGGAAYPGMPTGILPGVTYYVLAAGLSGSAFEVAYTPAGTAITPAAIGTGTQRVNYAANVALNGSLVNASGAAVLDVPRRVLITTADTTTTFTIKGTGTGGVAQSESFLIVGGASYSALDYATVTSITTSQAPTAAVTVGTNGIAATPWVRLDGWASPTTSIQVNVTGTVNYTVQVSDDDPNLTWVASPILPSAMTWIATNDPTVVGATASAQSNFIATPTFARVLLNSGSGSLNATFVQFDVVSR